uniref:phosphoribosylaminoimidazolesuccinocarboxamide synthase n=1 Tax=viral metagenome TaxID=1070528 RepID=A0A6C0CKA9_9ZZZZ
MERLNLAVLASGEGTNLQAIIEAIKANILLADIACVVSSKYESGALLKAKAADIVAVYTGETGCSEGDQDDEETLKNIILGFDVDIVVLAGWMKILSKNFIDELNSLGVQIINLHPALPGSHTGMGCIKKAWDDYTKRSGPDVTGVMVHHVVPEVDRGEVIQSAKVPIERDDTLETLTKRVKAAEKGVLISALQTLISKNTEQNIEIRDGLVYEGKVRNVYDVGFNRLVMEASTRTSAFDRHICNIPDKGAMLNDMSRWWFENTRHIVPNHFLASQDRFMLAKKCKPFMIEFVVRDYITGSTETSLWTHYSKGAREYCGVSFPNGLKKNQKLPNGPVLTPTTKGVRDVPISPEDIVKERYMTQEELDYCSHKALEVFEFGKKTAAEKGLILVDTKYEFGRCFETGQILLIDELHTCDSSRYWKADTYQQRFDTGEAPQNLDKDAVRRWVKENVEDPYSVEVMPEPPEGVVQNVRSTYLEFWKTLTGLTPEESPNVFAPSIAAKPDILNFRDTYFENSFNQYAYILSGSVRDAKHVQKIKDELEKKNIYAKSVVSSAHKTPKEVLAILDGLRGSSDRVVFVTVAGRSNALSGVVAANTQYPVIACPPFSDKMDMFTNINSSLQCPSNVPVMTVLEPSNVALCIHKMFLLSA